MTPAFPARRRFRYRAASPLPALPMVGEVFQQAFRNRWLDSKAEFAIARPPPPGPKNTALTDSVTDVLGRLWRTLRGK
jgi:penicillin-binding protein 1A